MYRKLPFLFAVTPLAILIGCSGSDVSTPTGAGGSVSVGGTSNLGGTPTTGGTGVVTNNGGGAGVGGSVGTGGLLATGGVPATGGAPASGGKAAGGTPATGGLASTGGLISTGGLAAAGGATATGGKGATGGSPATGGKAAGGTSATGGSNATTGGTPAAGGSAGSCGRTVGSCTAPTVNITSVTLNSAAQAAAADSDTAVIPLAIASLPSGGSRLAWLGTDNNVHIAQLDCNDALVGTPFTIPGIDLADIIADDNGGVVLVTRNATNGGTDQCGTVRPLCGGTSSPCRTMWMVRFDNSGAVTWETQVTNLSTTQAGYQNGAFFVWWYQHHGRLAFNGTNYAAIFGVSITVNNTVNGVACIDIHEGDRLQVVSSAGALVSAGSLAYGESHAWTSRILWDSRTSKFVATDATDDNCRVVSLPGATATTTTIGASTCDGNLFNGDVVTSSTAGYWDAWANAGQVTLAHFSTGAADQSVTGIAANLHPHLVTYGSSNMLLAWGSGTTITAQVRNSGTAAQVGSNLSIAANEQPYQAWKSYADGSVAYPAYNNSTSMKVVRVMPCQ